MQYTEKDLAKLIEDVEKEFTAHLAKAEIAKSEASAPVAPEATEVLTKAEDEKKPEEKKKEKEEKEEKPEESKEEAKEPAKEEHKEEAPKEEPKHEEPKAEEKHDDDDSHDYDDEDLEHMHKMYSSMKKGELKAHHDAVKKCLDAHMAKCGDMSQEQPGQMAKSEEAVEETLAKSENNEVELLKSELETEKSKGEELKKSLDAVSAFLTKLVEKTAPKAKAITSLDVIAKSEAPASEQPLTKSEINSVLAKKAADPSLSKSDRDAINAYYLNGASINTISHLLK